MTEGAAYGAALPGRRGRGCVWQRRRGLPQGGPDMTDRTQPGSAVSMFEDYYPRYHTLYPALAPEFEPVAKVVSKHLAAGEEP